MDLNSGCKELEQITQSHFLNINLNNNDDDGHNEKTNHNIYPRHIVVQ